MARTRIGSVELLEDRLPLAAELLIDLNPANLGLNPQEFTVYGDEIYFTSNPGEVLNAELWKTDGTQLGTHLVVSMGEGEITDMAVVDDQLTMLVSRPLDHDHDTYELLAFDRTSHSFRTLATQLEGTNRYSGGTSRFFLGDNQAYFLADRFPFDNIGTLHVTNGDSVTNSERHIHLPCRWLDWPGASGRGCQLNDDLLMIGDVLYYSTKLYSNGGQTGPPGASFDVVLWAYDGDSPPRLVRTLSDDVRGVGIAEDFTQVGDLFYFTAPAVVQSGERMLWVSDGTDAGTRLVESPLEGARLTNWDDLTQHDDKLYFTASLDSQRLLWVVDNGEMTPEMVAGVRVNRSSGLVSSAVGLALINDSNDSRHIWLIGSEGRANEVGGVPSSYQFVVGQGSNLLFSEKHADGTQLHLFGLQVGQVQSLGLVGRSLAEVFVANDDLLLFQATHDEARDLWVIEGGSLRQVQMPARSGSISALGPFSTAIHIDGTQPTGGAIIAFMSGTEPINFAMEPSFRVHILVTDGSRAGTFVARGETRTYGIDDAYQVGREVFGPGGDEFASFKIHLDTQELSRSSPDDLIDADPRFELSTRKWSPAPFTFEGTLLVSPTVMYQSNSYPAMQTAHGRYAVVGHGLEDRKVVREVLSEGVEEAFDAVFLESLEIDIVFSNRTRPRFDMQSIGDELYFVARDETHGSELWSSDGTLEGTRLVRDIYAGSRDSDIALLGVSGERLYFLADDGLHGREIWTYTPPLRGDVDNSGAVDLHDLVILAGNFGNQTERGRQDGDLDDDGRVDFSDFLELAKHFDAVRFS